MNLSARGSRNLPKFVTRFLALAIFPSARSVSAVTRNNAAAIIRATNSPPMGYRMNTIQSGTRIILSTVSLFGRLSFITVLLKFIRTYVPQGHIP